MEIDNQSNNNRDTFDLYDKINGEWERTFQIPDNEPEWGTMHEIRKDVENKLKKMLNDPSSDYLHQLFSILLNLESKTDSLEAQGLVPILSFIDPSKYDNENRKNMGHAIGLLETMMVNPLFSIGANLDPKDATTVRLNLSFPDLTLPDKIYYIDPSYSDYVDEFKLHAQSILSTFSSLVANSDKLSYLTYLNGSDMGADVVEIETLIAQSVRSAEEKRELDSFYSRQPYPSFIQNISMCGVQTDYDCQSAKELWKGYFETTYKNIVPELQKFYPDASSKTPDEIIVYDTPYFQKLTKILMTQPVQKIIRYLAYHIITGISMIMIRSFDETYNRFISFKLNGQKAPTPRDDRVLKVIDNYLGESIGKEYIRKYFDQQSKDIVIRMAEKIKSQMRQSIRSNTWMSEKTKESGLRKLDSMVIKIGYPDRYEDREYMIDGIKQRLNSYKRGEPSSSITSILLYIRTCYFSQDILARIDTKRDPTRWSMNPHDVNAYYSPQMNEIVFPAGILSKPIFDPNQNPAINYGGIGMVIAHEITHGFDDQGRKYDHQGNINNWWTPADLSSFKSRTKKMIDQYSNYEVQIEDPENNTSSTMNVNGALTLGENIADLGGVTLSFRAYLDDIGDQTVENKKKFFEAYALLWRKKVSPSKTVSRLLSDPHSPGRYRVWVVRNFDPFYETYSIRPGSVMYLEPEDRIAIY